ncbi:MAG: Gfo/Idh/MocA family oxidoreductase [Phycisphaerales bacterium]|nr:Gfo/Idh/MocA family oxidoreductase [Phycisphaerales bacterium]
MPGPSLNVGLIGYQFMGKAHSNAWLQAPHFFDLPLHPVMHTLSGRSLAPLQKTAKSWNWQHYTQNYKDMLTNPDIGLIDIATPNNAHAELAIAAAEAKKDVACEKPLARTWSEAKAMHAAVKKAKVNNFLWFNYRRVPAVAYARQLVLQGRIGRIFHVRGLYLQDWIKSPNTPFVWRLSKSVAGSGSHGDLCAHTIDMLRYISGEEFTEVCGTFETFIKQRPLGRMLEGLTASSSGSQKLAKVDVDDAVLFLCRLSGGGLGTFEATRFATGYHNANTLEINGDKGSLRFDLPNFSFLEFYDDTLPASEKGWRKISCTTANHPYAGQYWPPDHPIGYAESFVNTAADITSHIANAKKPADFHANFDDGLACQQILEAVTVSAKEKCWIKTKEIR